MATLVAIVWHPDAPREIDNATRDALREISDVVYNHARIFVPKVTGELHRSMAIEFIAPMTFRIGAYAPYAHFVELGTSKMHPRPFLRPALFSARVAAVVARQRGGL